MIVSISFSSTTTCDTNGAGITRPVRETECIYLYTKMDTDISYFIVLSDIDECVNSSMNKCSYKSLCFNIAGSYQCKCPTGTYLENDKRTCTSKCACIIYMYKYYWLGRFPFLYGAYC